MTYHLHQGPASLWLNLALMTAISGCSNADPSNATAPPAPASPNAINLPVIDPYLGEHLFADEKAIALQTSLLIEKTLRKQYRPGEARRDAHPKSHGCVKAEFRIAESLPEHLAKGMFIPGKTYQAWIRFSNGSSDATRADIKHDARGMAIKVLGVPGQKILPGEEEADTQDFIMINHPVFFANDPGRYLSLIKHQGSGSVWDKLRAPFDLGAKGTLIALQTINKKIANPVQTRYWSMVPYQLGTGPDRQAVKYSARACSTTAGSLPDKPGHDYLRDALRNTLQNGDACMEFLVQPRTSSRMEVEDSMTEWKEADAPFYKVATLHIPRQVFDTPEQNRFCENLSFTPWHSLPEHKPLGVTNRARKVIYDHVSRVRHEMNSATRQEPH